jgi:hypothetical protein
MADMGASIDPADRNAVLEAIDLLKQAMNTSDTAEIKRLTAALTSEAHRLASSAYGQQNGTGYGPSPGANQTHQNPGKAGNEDDVVDADFEEVA